jgi:hypothetical protein
MLRLLTACGVSQTADVFQSIILNRVAFGQCVSVEKSREMIRPDARGLKELRWDGMIALMGKTDPLTDGVRDHCTFVGDAILRRGGEWRVVDLDWEKTGWGPALRRLDQMSRDWRGKWVLVQYTALMWSRRGFPTRFLSLLRRLKRNGARIAVHTHRASGQPVLAAEKSRARSANSDIR